ncbi:MAG: C25 family cysteine peptidase [bacterium]|nr:C25 family cysteine peptidase [bacterium]
MHRTRSILALLLVLTTVPLGFGAVVTADPGGPDSARVTLISQNSREIILEFRLGSMRVDTVEDNGVFWTAVSAPGMEWISECGQPELPELSVWLRVGEDAAQVTVLEADSASFVWGTIRPAPEIMLRTDSGLLRRVPDPARYTGRDMFPATPCRISLQGGLGAARVALVTFTPVQYRPRSGDYLVQTRLRVRVSPGRGGALDQSSDLPRSTKDLLARLAMNPPPDEETIRASSPRLLLITEPGFLPALEPWIIWKRRSGLPVQTVIYSAVASDANSLRDYIRHLSDSLPALPEFALIVGDVDVIPPFFGVSGSLTDHPYSLLDDEDYLPDMSLGRVPCADQDALSDWVQRVLNYERDAVTINPLGTVAASSQALDPQHGAYVTTLFQSNGMTVDRLQQPASSSLPNLMNSLNAGGQWVFYIGHGNAQAWTSLQPHFTNSAVGELTSDRTPIVVSVACATADLDFPGLSIAEYWLAREASHGPLAYFGATESTAFFRSDTIGIGALRAIFARGCERMGTACDLGRLECAQAFPQSPGGVTEETIQQFVLLGDPSMRVFTAPPPPLVVLHPSTIHAADSNLTVYVSRGGHPLAGAWVCLSSDSLPWYRVLTTDLNGSAVCSALPAESGVLRIVATAFNTVPYQGEIVLSGGDQPLLHIAEFRVLDEQGDGDGNADRSESCALKIRLVNRGSAASPPGSLAILPDSCLEFPVPDLGIPALAGEASAWLDPPLSFAVCDDASDAQIALLRVVLSLPGDTNTSALPLLLHAPNLEYRGGRVEPDTTQDNSLHLSLRLVFVNIGSEPVIAPACSLMGLPDEVSYLGMESVSPLVAPGDSLLLTAYLSAPRSLPRGFPLSCGYRISGANLPDQYHSDVLRVGQVPVFLCVLDRQPQQVDAVESALNSLGIEYERDAALPADLFRYASIWIFAGVYPNAEPLGTPDAVRLASYLDQGGRCYLEGGDIWAYQSPAPLAGYFHITALSDGSANAGPVGGNPEAFSSGMVFEYAGENSFMDQLAAGDGAELLLRNQRPGANYAVCVAYDGGAYRTVGSSIELGSLTDDQFPSTRVNLFREIAEFFGMASRADVFPPQIVHESVAQFTRAFAPIPIIADIQDASGVARAEIEYRVDDGAASQISMDVRDGLFVAALPGAPFGSRVFYRVLAADAAPLPNTAETPEYSFPIVANPTIALHTSFASPARIQIQPRIALGASGSWSLTDYPEDVPVLELHGCRGEMISYTTESFDCSGLHAVQLSFWNYLREIAPAREVVARVLGSDDGGVSFPHVVWQSTPSGGGILSEGRIVVGDLAWMDGQSGLVLKFEYDGDWYWQLRDLVVAGTTPPVYAPVRDLTIHPTPQGMLLTWGVVENAVSYEVHGTMASSYNAPWEVIAGTTKTMFTDQDESFTMRFYKVRAIVEESVPPPGWISELASDAAAAEIRLPDLRWNRKLERSAAQ